MTDNRLASWSRSWTSPASSLMRDALLASSFDKSMLLSLQLRRQERKRQLVYFGAIKDKEEHEEADNMTMGISSVGSSRKSSSSTDLSPSDVSMLTSSTSALSSASGYSSASSTSPSTSSSHSFLHPSSQCLILIKELEQWIRKMRCSGQTGQQLEHFSDINVGCNPEPVVRKSPTLEPYCRLRDVLLEKRHKYEGGRDDRGLPNGRGVLEMANGDIVSGTFRHGQREGLCRVECNSNNLKVIVGNYHNDCLEGKAKVVYENNEWLEAYFVEGVMHGFGRKFDANGFLSFVGNFRNGKPSGNCWLVVRNGGYVVGRVEERNGDFTATRMAYIYPDLYTAIIGSFHKGVLEYGQRGHLRSVMEEEHSMKVPLFTRPEGAIYRREVATTEWMTNWPLLPDPYESRMVEVRSSKVCGAGEGLFSRQNVEPNTVLAFYNGQRIAPRSFGDCDHQDWNLNAYKIFDPTQPTATIDIPMAFRQLTRYNASLAHKTNHSFCPNAEIVTFEHPRFGLVPAIMATHDIKQDEEIFVHYGYELSGCPDWYEAGWMKGDYPIPDSMRALYSVDNKDKKEESKEDKKEEENKEEDSKEDNKDKKEEDNKDREGTKEMEEEDSKEDNNDNKEDNKDKKEEESKEDEDKKEEENKEEDSKDKKEEENKEEDKKEEENKEEDSKEDNNDKKEEDSKEEDDNKDKKEEEEEESKENKDKEDRAEGEDDRDEEYREKKKAEFLEGNEEKKVKEFNAEVKEYNEETHEIQENAGDITETFKSTDYDDEKTIEDDLSHVEAEVPVKEIETEEEILEKTSEAQMCTQSGEDQRILNTHNAVNGDIAQGGFLSETQDSSSRDSIQKETQSEAQNHFEHLLCEKGSCEELLQAQTSSEREESVLINNSNVDKEADHDH